jgi:hypothetical protein
MGIATVLSREQRGIDAPLVRVEVDIGPGLPSFNIVGLPEAVVKESKDRVRAALTNSDFQFPYGRITETMKRPPAFLCRITVDQPGWHQSPPILSEDATIPFMAIE